MEKLNWKTLHTKHLHLVPKNTKKESQIQLTLCHFRRNKCYRPKCVLVGISWRKYISVEGLDFRSCMWMFVFYWLRKCWYSCVFKKRCRPIKRWVLWELVISFRKSFLFYGMKHCDTNGFKTFITIETTLAQYTKLFHVVTNCIAKHK